MGSIWQHRALKVEFKTLTFNLLLWRLVFADSLDPGGCDQESTGRLKTLQIKKTAVYWFSVVCSYHSEESQHPWVMLYYYPSQTSTNSRPNKRSLVSFSKHQHKSHFYGRKRPAGRHSVRTPSAELVVTDVNLQVWAGAQIKDPLSAEPLCPLRKCLYPSVWTHRGKSLTFTEENSTPHITWLCSYSRQRPKSNVKLHQ